MGRIPPRAISFRWAQHWRPSVYLTLGGRIIARRYNQLRVLIPRPFHGTLSLLARPPEHRGRVFCGIVEQRSRLVERGGRGACVRMSPGAGLRPTPPPLLRTQAPLPPRVRNPGGFGTGSDYPQAEPLRGWRAFRQSKGGGDRHRRATGDICRNACHPRSGPTLRCSTDRRKKAPADAGAFHSERRGRLTSSSACTDR